LAACSAVSAVGGGSALQTRQSADTTRQIGQRAARFRRLAADPRCKLTNLPIRPARLVNVQRDFGDVQQIRAAD
jgi:hypothetical protein